MRRYRNAKRSFRYRTKIGHTNPALEKLSSVVGTYTFIKLREGGGHEMQKAAPPGYPDAALEVIGGAHLWCAATGWHRTYSEGKARIDQFATATAMEVNIHMPGW